MKRTLADIYGTDVYSSMMYELTTEQQEQLDRMVEIFRETFPRMKDFVPVRKPDTREQWWKDWERIWGKAPAEFQRGVRRSAQIYPDLEPGVYLNLFGGRGNGKSLMQEKIMDAITEGQLKFPVMPKTFKGLEPGNIAHLSMEMKEPRVTGIGTMGVQDIDKLVGIPFDIESYFHGREKK